MRKIDPAIITALISGGSAAAAAIVVAVIQSRSQHNKTVAELEKRDAVQDEKLDKFNALQTERLEHLTKEVQKHNSIVERTFELERNVSVIKEEIKVANHRIDDLEQLGRKGAQP